MSILLLIIPLALIGMLALISYIISKMAWERLAEKFATGPEFEGHRVGIISAGINSANYQNSLILKYNNRGIYLRPTIPFRLFHKPVLIPWSEFKSVRNKKILFYNFKEIVVGDPFVAMITMKDSTFDKINWPVGVFGSLKV